MLPEESPVVTPERASPRVADHERDRVIGLLRLHCADGRISLDEFGDRVAAAYAATYADELDSAVADLPVPWRDSPGDSPRPTPRWRTIRWLVAIFGDSDHRGRFRLGNESGVLALFGDCVLDLSEATIDAESPVVNAVALFGDVTIVVPEGIEVQMDGLAIFGDKRCESPSASPGSTVISVRALACFGAVRVRPANDRDRRRRARPSRR